MTRFASIVRGGTVVDGTGAPRYGADLGIADGRIAAIGELGSAQADRIIDASGLIVAPGIVDVHTHYDAQVHWDPYCTNSSWHGVTTAVVSNCGFGFAPCRPEARERYMRMMENTEQVPYRAMRTALSWNWEDFASYMAVLRAQPKGINLATYLPLNPLLCYVMGADAAKSRAATATERARMRDILHEAMDLGAIGFAFSHLQQFNSHVDYDGTPMPTDTMAIDEAYSLAEVLRERGEGVIHALLHLPGALDNSHYAEELAKRSGRPVIHNIVAAFDMMPDAHRGVLQWLDGIAAQNLPIYSQTLGFRVWTEFRICDYNAWDHIAPFREFSNCGGAAAMVEKAKDADWRARLKAAYTPQAMMSAGGLFETFYLHKACGDAKWTEFEGRLLGEIAQQLGVHVVDLFFDIGIATGMTAHFRTGNAVSEDPDKVMDMMGHPRVLAGTSDGGAHCKFYSGGQYGTDFLTWLVREEKRMTLEQMHAKLSSLPARVLGFADRGELREGYAADLMIYDFDRLGYDRSGYRIAHDLPGGDWRRTVDAQGIEWVIVNGVPIFRNNNCQGVTPGELISNHPLPRAQARPTRAAA